MSRLRAEPLGAASLADGMVRGEDSGPSPLPPGDFPLYLPHFEQDVTCGIKRPAGWAGPWEIYVAVRIRLKRIGRRHRPAYRLTAMDSRSARDSKVIEELGSYNPMFPQAEKQIKIDRERVEYWLSVGAQPTDTVRRLLEREGILPGSAASK